MLVTYLIQKLTKVDLNSSYDTHTKGIAMIYDASNSRVYFDTEGLYEAKGIKNYKRDKNRDEAVISFLISNSDTLVFVMNDLDTNIIDLITSNEQKLEGKNLIFLFNLHNCENYSQSKKNLKDNKLEDLQNGQDGEKLYPFIMIESMKIYCAFCEHNPTMKDAEDLISFLDKPNRG